LCALVKGDKFSNCIILPCSVYTNFLGSFILMFFLHIFIQRRSEELACASREQADSANGVGNNAPSGSRGSGIVLPFSATHNASTYGDEFDTTIITFNTVCLAM